VQIVCPTSRCTSLLVYVHRSSGKIQTKVSPLNRRPQRSFLVRPCYRFPVPPPRIAAGHSCRPAGATAFSLASLRNRLTFASAASHQASCAAFFVLNPKIARPSSPNSTRLTPGARVKRQRRHVPRFGPALRFFDGASDRGRGVADIPGFHVFSVERLVGAGQVIFFVIVGHPPLPGV
jgi:hypothetical protein